VSNVGVLLWRRCYSNEVESLWAASSESYGTEFRAFAIAVSVSKKLYYYEGVYPWNC